MISSETSVQLPAHEDQADRNQMGFSIGCQTGVCQGS
jgi:hypothetical protein